MRVAVLGSWQANDIKSWKLRGTLEQFQAACRQLGGELVNRGHSLIVGADSPNTADGNAVLGAIDAIDKDASTLERPRILVMRPGSGQDGRAFDALRRKRPGLFVEYQVESEAWPAVKLFQIQRADAVILLGGAEKTEQAGLTAAVTQKPLACIGSFGGAANKLNDRFRAAPNTWGYEPGQELQLNQLQDEFNDHVLQIALKVAWIADAPKLMIIHGHSPDHRILEQYLAEHVTQVIVAADVFDPTTPITTKVERLASSVDGAIALVTPDDVGGLADSPGATQPRARENVWVEVGWFWGRRGRSKVLLLKKGEVTFPSDLANVEHVAYQSSPIEGEAEQAIQRFIAKLRSASDT